MIIDSLGVYKKVMKNIYTKDKYLSLTEMIVPFFSLENYNNFFIIFVHYFFKDAKISFFGFIF